jgi:glycosyltransferase involved in cell wall biosynthesis
MIEGYAPDTVHIATEGPLGLWARRYLVRRAIPFTSSLHTKFPEYVNERVALPLSVGYRYLRWFHRPSSAVLCTTESHRQELLGWGMGNLVVWGRGVDTARFRPGPRAPRRRPQVLYVGRVAVEKNVEAFLNLPVDADKLVVGDGPARGDLQRRYPDARWLGFQRGSELVSRSRRRRCAGVPVSHRHLRSGDARGHGLRYAGGGVSGHRPS